MTNIYTRYYSRDRTPLVLNYQTNRQAGEQLASLYTQRVAERSSEISDLIDQRQLFLSTDVAAQQVDYARELKLNPARYTPQQLGSDQFQFV